MKLLSKKTSVLQDSHAQLPKLNRVTGQLEGIKRMIESDRACPDVLIQLRSVRAAIKSIESNLLNNHLQMCLKKSLNNEKEQEKTLNEIQTLFSRFEN
ncbi:MAG: metal-sensitive transcriptional regulator [Alphaproteobacteria bacterium]|nr:metal-sensitive transcriptional regulator [Alphaproteobacteria bacterium]